MCFRPWNTSLTVNCRRQMLVTSDRDGLQRGRRTGVGMTITTSIKIPALSCPVVSGLNANVQRLNEAGLAWISQYRMFSDVEWCRYVAMLPGYLPGHVMPTAPMGPGLLAASNLLFWLWAYDDLECDEVHARTSSEAHIVRLCELGRIVETPATVSSANPFVASLSDLRRQVDEAASPMQAARWASAMQEYFLANTAVAIHNIRGTLPDLDSYVAQRIHSGAVKPCLMMLVPPVTCLRSEAGASVNGKALRIARDCRRDNLGASVVEMSQVGQPVRSGG